MKQSLLFLILFLVAVISKGQNTDAIIQSIKTKYQQLQKNHSRYTTDSVDLPDQSLEGGMATAWYQGKEVKMIQAVYYGESGKMEWNYYFDSSRLFFVLKKEYAYNTAMYIDAKTAKENNIEAFDPAKSRIEEDRFYFDKGRVIRWLNGKGKQVNTATKNSRAAIADILADSGKLRNSMKK